MYRICGSFLAYRYIFIIHRLIKENKMKFETHNSFTESRNLDIGLDSDDYKLPFFE